MQNNFELNKYQLHSIKEIHKDTEKTLLQKKIIVTLSMRVSTDTSNIESISSLSNKYIIIVFVKELPISLSVLKRVHP